MFLKRLAVAGLVIGMGVAAFSLQTVAQQGTPVVTFHKDVLPILQANCQTCHRPGEAAPFSMLTYKDTRPWASSMKRAAVSRTMPPWLADPHFSDLKLQNDRTLTQQEIDTVAAWADGGSPRRDE